MKKLVILSGAGMSAESGISTFRDSGGLWENYDVMKVASIEGWLENPELVLQFYNERRNQLKDCEPNEGHKLIAGMESEFEITIITQNVDDLHERAGSSNIIHLHGELTKACSSINTKSIYNIGYESINIGDKAEDGSQLRPFIVWFGEAVPMIEKAIEIVSKADILVIVGTSLQVYPAASLINYVRIGIPVYLIDPNDVKCNSTINIIREKASKGIDLLKQILERSK